MSLGAPLARLARDARQFADGWPREGATIIERALQSELSSAPGGGNVSGVGSATVDVKAGPGTADVSAGGSRAVWVWCENGTQAHDVAAKSSKRTAALRTPYGPRRRVHVGGWRARHTWTRGVASADPKVMRDAMTRLDKLVP